MRDSDAGACLASFREISSETDSKTLSLEIELVALGNLHLLQLTVRDSVDQESALASGR